MKFPNPMEHWNEWSFKMGYEPSFGNLEAYWLKFLRINKKWWLMMKTRCPCEKCKFLDSCPDMYGCPEWVEWAMTEE